MPGGARDATGARSSTTVPCPASAEVVIVGAGIGGLAFARELAARGVRDIVVLERGYPGGGATGRNVARIRAMQLTEDLTHVARACQAKYDRMGEELGFNVLFYRLGYAWVLYDADEVERMRSIVEMHHRIGVASQFLSPDDTLRRLPILRGGDPVAGAVLNDDAIVHHDAVVWAHLEHLAGDVRADHARRHGPGDRDRATAGVEAVETDRGRIATRAVLNAAGGWSTAAQRPRRRLGAEPPAPARGPRHGAGPALDRGRRHVLPPERGLVQPDAARRDRHGRDRPGRGERREPAARRGTSCAGRRR